MGSITNEQYFIIRYKNNFFSISNLIEILKRASEFASSPQENEILKVYKKSLFEFLICKNKYDDIKKDNLQDYLKIINIQLENNPKTKRDIFDEIRKSKFFLNRIRDDELID